MTYILRTHNLTKTIKRKEIISNVSLNIKKGEIYGFLGPNGAGKTTIMKMITNLIKPTSGEIEIFGEKLINSSIYVLGRIGSIIENPIFYDKLTAKENLELHCEYMGYHDLEVIDESLKLVNLRGADDKAVKDFSLGMKQRLGIARAICTRPEFVILDEPINGLDPIGIKEIRDLFLKLSKEFGITIFISSHILGEIELVADTIGVINHGRLIKEVSMEEIRSQNMDYIEVKSNNCERVGYILEHFLSITNFKVIDNKYIRVYDSKIAPNEIMKILVMKDVPVESINLKRSSLEDYFLSLLNRGDIHV